MLLDTINGYRFLSRSGGVVVLKGHSYKGFFETLSEACHFIFGD
jgi:hypothetical protein